MASRLPRQVQAQLDAAQAVLDAQAAPPPAVTGTEPPPPEHTPQPTQPPVDPVALPQPPAPPAATPAPENWEHKYKVLQGMFRTQGDALKTLERQVQELQRPQPTPTPAPTQPPQPTVDPKDVEDFGLPMVSMVQRVMDQYLVSVRQVLEARFTQIESGLNELKQRVQGTTETVAMTAEELFFTRLAEQVPNWQAINDAPEFLAYLDEIDPVFGQPRGAALQQAHAQGNAQRAAAVFKAFIATLPPPPVAPPPESPSPRGAASAAPPTSGEKQMFRSAEVEKFYADVARGVYRSNPAEQARREAIFNAALAEGRIRP